MKGKTLENIVLGLGILVIGAALFLMYVDTNGVAAKSINIIFSTGFIIYIAYSYILSNNLNNEIRGLEKHVQNLKEEVGRQKETIAKRDSSIANLHAEVSNLTENMASIQTELTEKSEALEAANTALEALKTEASKGE